MKTFKRVDNKEVVFGLYLAYSALTGEAVVHFLFTRIDQGSCSQFVSIPLDDRLFNNPRLQAILDIVYLQTMTQCLLLGRRMNWENNI